MLLTLIIFRCTLLEHQKRANPETVSVDGFAYHRFLVFLECEKLKSLARLAYDVERKARAVARREAIRRGDSGDIKYFDQRKASIRKKAQKGAKSSGLDPGKVRAQAEVNLVEEIKGAGDFGLGKVGYGSPGSQQRAASLFSEYTTRVHNLKNFKDKYVHVVNDPVNYQAIVDQAERRIDQSLEALVKETNS